METSTAYGVNVTGVSVGGDAVDVRLFAKFDTGSSFTHLLEPAYGVLTKAVCINFSSSEKMLCC